MTNIKTFWYLLIALVVFSFFIYKNRNFEFSSDSISKNISVANVQTNLASTQSIENNDNNEPIFIANSSSTKNRETLNINLYKNELLEERGYIVFDSASYQGYDKEVLEEMLIQALDKKAAYVLMTKLLEEGKLQEAENIFLFGAALGSTSVIELKTNFLLKKARGTTDQHKKKEYFLETLSLYELAILRGDLIKISMGGQLLKNTQLNLTESDINSISRKAIEMYNSLEIKRKNIGLETFDNRVYPVDIQMLKSTESYFQLNGGLNKWVAAHLNKTYEEKY